MAFYNGKQVLAVVRNVVEQGDGGLAYLENATSLSFMKIAADDETGVQHFPNLNLPRAKKVDFSENERVETIGDVYAPNYVVEGASACGFYKTYNLRSIGVVSFPKTKSLYRTFANSGVEEIGGVVFNEAVSVICARMFDGSSKLKRIGGQLDLTNCSDTNYMFNGCIALEHIEFVAGSIHISIDFKSCKKLTTESWGSIFNGLADLTGQTACTLTIPASAENPPTENQRATATAKNWTIAEA